MSYRRKRPNKKRVIEIFAEIPNYSIMNVGV